MKNWKRVTAFVLTVCMILSMLPPVQIVHAAQTIQRYELDKDGIDPGATYLIVNTSTAGSANALKFNYSSNSSRDLSNQAVTIKQQDDISAVHYIETGFTNEADCQFQFSSANAGNITHGNYYLDLRNSRYASGSSGNTLTFTHAGNGQYSISYSSRSGWFNTTTYYLRYSDDDWSRSTTSSSVYLYKLVDHVVSYDVTFDGNDYTSGTLPENRTGLSSGDTITAPSADLRKDVGEDTWLFLCWNTEPDGSGTEYAPNETITVTKDITLYAQWYQQTKYSVSMITYLDDVATDIDEIAGYEKQFYARLEVDALADNTPDDTGDENPEGTNGDSAGSTTVENENPYIHLTRQGTGVYSAKVTKNGTYVIYTMDAQGNYEPVHGHTVIIYNQDGTTECMHYSVTYDANDGAWADGESPAAEIHHYGEAATAYDKQPTRDGYRFLGWEDQDGKLYAPGQRITDSISGPIALTAKWEPTITVTVEVVIDHNPVTGGADNDSHKGNVTITLLREENGVNLPVRDIVLPLNSKQDEDVQYQVTYGETTTTYTVVFADMPRGIYHVASAKSGYEIINNTSQSDENGNQNINLGLQYKPDNFDLTFDVVVNADDTEKTLMPKAVNVKVTYWGYNKNNELGWHTITQQEGTNAPTTVYIDQETGTGTSSFPVWRYWSETGDGIQHAYEYRVEVTSFILPDDTIVPATGNHVNYTIDGSGLYQAVVSIAAYNGDGRRPNYPKENTEDAAITNQNTLYGAYYDGSKQVGKPVVTVNITPYTVIFNAGDGTVNGQQTITLTGQYRYPDLHDYVAVPNTTDDRRFVYWMVNDDRATNLAGQLLKGNVTYTARYNKDFTLTGTVTADATYQQDGQTVYIHDIDRAEKVYVVLQKKVGDVYNDVQAVPVTLGYVKDETTGEYTVGTGEYEFTDLPNDDTEYRVYLLVRNYTGSYNNNGDKTYAVGESVAVIDELKAEAQVDIHLTFTPDQYQQAIRVDASQIHEGLRPTGVLTQILYRDLGDVHSYDVISQHTVAPFGVMVDINSADATGLGFDDVWNWHTDGAPYEYQVQVSKVYGNDVAGAYSAEGTAYSANSPYTVVYGRPNNYLQQEQEGGVMLEATLVPKQYAVELDLNLGEDTSTPVVGLEEYMVDDGSGNERYVFLHTWSYTEQFTAYPYREGYVFKGWKVQEAGTDSNTEDVYIEQDHDGVIHVGKTLAKNITLVAQWEELTGTAYTVRYLELNTDKVLKGATMVSDSAAGVKVAAVDAAIDIKGYVYAGAMVNGEYISKIYNPAMTITNDPMQNLMIIYYLPDGSDGYTEQVESNLEINKTAVLENDGTYTITLDTYTKDNPITTLIQQNTPLDIVMVLDQSASIVQGGYLDELKAAVNNFVDLVAKHGRNNEVDHRIAIVGYAGAEISQAFDNTITYPIAGGDTKEWVNTGVFDSNGDFHTITVTGFNYKELEAGATIDANGVYYTKVGEKYLLLTYHSEYRHLISETEAITNTANNIPVYGYVDGEFVPLTRNSSGLWLYGEKLLYSETKFFTYHTDVWTHRDGVEARQIHAYGVGANYAPVDGHTGVYVREETKGENPQLNVYEDALVPVSVGANGSGGINPGLLNATSHLGSNGQTYVQYGLEMANRVFEANPLEENTEGRIRIVVMFTDGMPGAGTFDETEANAAISKAQIAKNTHDALVYTVGLYPSDGVNATDDEGFFMNAVSSNYREANNLEDVRTETTYTQAPDSDFISVGGPYYVNVGEKYYELTSKVAYQNRQYWYSWGYEGEYGRVAIYETTDSSQKHPSISGGKVGEHVIYKKSSAGYKETPHSGYYSTTDSEAELQQYFAQIVQDITTKITTEIVLHEDTILRDIMNQGLVLTPDTVVTAYAVPGEMKEDGEVEWATLDPVNHKIASVTIPNLPLEQGDVVVSSEVFTMTDSSAESKKVPYIQIYNLNSTNPTDPTKADYHPHTVDITGYDFTQWYISENHPKGFKMVVTITRVEATDDVEWGRSTATNNDQSGLWLPADAQGKRQLLLPFDQPTTIFTERVYVLDYGKPVKLTGWYFDDEVDKNGEVVEGKDATPVHVDFNIEDGMNGFNTANTQNTDGGIYGKTTYGNVQLVNGEVTYTPTTTQWNGYDQFYVFGNTWRNTVLAQDANQNGNLWNKVTVIPANNVYYEDSFITATSNTNQNGIDGFTFSDTVWEVEGEDSGNTEDPEKQEETPYGDVHGWTDSLQDDQTFTDGSAHRTDTPGAKAELTFTGTGVEVYTRTNAQSGMVVAVLSQISEETITAYKTIAVDNLAVSGDYYHIPTVAFKNLPYGTYKLQLIAAAADAAVPGVRNEYYIDGVRILNPLGRDTSFQTEVKNAYGLENNAVFTEVRDVLLDYKDFNTELPDSTDGKMGAVFIDWIGTEQSGIGQPTYDVGIFETYGPKNEVYLTAGQAIVLKVDETQGNTYYVGLKSLTGDLVTAHVSGIDQADPTAIKLSHTTDMYYQVTPVNGYIVIQNGSGSNAAEGESGNADGNETGSAADGETISETGDTTGNGPILSITNLRTTNLTAPAANGGIIRVTAAEAEEVVSEFAEYMANKPEEEIPQPEEQLPSAEEQALANEMQAMVLFADVRQWLATE